MVVEIVALVVLNKFAVFVCPFVGWADTTGAAAVLPDEAAAPLPL